MAMTTSDILFSRQFHNADRAGPHYDVRLIQGKDAWSFATRKPLPMPGKAIMLYETEIHTREYALRKYIVTPKGKYGAGTHKLVDLDKATLSHNTEKGHYVIQRENGERYLLKQMPIAGGKSWLLKRLDRVN